MHAINYYVLLLRIRPSAATPGISRVSAQLPMGRYWACLNRSWQGLPKTQNCWNLIVHRNVSWRGDLMTGLDTPATGSMKPCLLLVKYARVALRENQPFGLSVGILYLPNHSEERCTFKGSAYGRIIIDTTHQMNDGPTTVSWTRTNKKQDIKLVWTSSFERARGSPRAARKEGGQPKNKYSRTPCPGKQRPYGQRYRGKGVLEPNPSS